MEQIKRFSSGGDEVLLEYDPATEDMKEVNKAIDQFEKQFAGRAFSMATGEAVEKVTPETRDITIIRPVAGG